MSSLLLLLLVPVSSTLKLEECVLPTPPEHFKKIQLPFRDDTTYMYRDTLKFWDYPYNIAGSLYFSQDHFRDLDCAGPLQKLLTCVSRDRYPVHHLTGLYGVRRAFLSCELLGPRKNEVIEAVNERLDAGRWSIVMSYGATYASGDRSVMMMML